MGATDLLALVLFSSFGVWWFVAPQSVIAFYSWLRRKPLTPRPNPIAIRITGLLWVVLVVSVVAFVARR
jgi:hypothetical protein